MRWRVLCLEWDVAGSLLVQVDEFKTAVVVCRQAVRPQPFEDGCGLPCKL